MHKLFTLKNAIAICISLRLCRSSEGSKLILEIYCLCANSFVNNQHFRNLLSRAFTWNIEHSERCSNSFTFFPRNWEMSNFLRIATISSSITQFQPVRSHCEIQTTWLMDVHGDWETHFNSSWLGRTLKIHDWSIMARPYRVITSVLNGKSMPDL